MASSLGRWQVRLREGSSVPCCPTSTCMCSTSCGLATVPRMGRWCARGRLRGDVPHQEGLRAGRGARIGLTNCKRIGLTNCKIQQTVGWRRATRHPETLPRPGWSTSRARAATRPGRCGPLWRTQSRTGAGLAAAGRANLGGEPAGAGRAGAEPTRTQIRAEGTELAWQAEPALEAHARPALARWRPARSPLQPSASVRCSASNG